MSGAVTAKERAAKEETAVMARHRKNIAK